MTANVLYYGDNLKILRSTKPVYIPAESVDLVYLDPPFNSKATYNVLFREKDGSRAAAQFKAFEDTWHWDETAAWLFEEVVEAGGDPSSALRAFKTLLGTNDMLAYLSNMAPRLIELRRVMKPEATLYLHCDPTASHYLKILLDAIFGAKNFLNEIAWCYDTGGRATSSFPRKHDVIFRYARDVKRTAFYYDQVALPRDFSTMHETVQTDAEGRRFQRNIKAGKEYRYYEDRGVLPNDWWADIQALNPAAKERLSYPTQKPEALLERILKASSREGDVVLDPFCGCGTTIAVAERLKRRWLGIDITHLAINLIKHRLLNAFGDGVAYGVIGEPESVSGAKMLARDDPMQFQSWALGLVGARPERVKRGADMGIDGRAFFHERPGGDTKEIILSVKGGSTGVKDVRELGHVVRREEAQIGALLTMREPTRPMREEAAAAGFYESPWGKHPRLQLLTIAQLLDRKNIDRPPTRAADTTFKKAPRVANGGAEQLGLDE